ncbi:hypothetical protein FAI41_04875 [Acetobacteraceae bacterium]|nr:hypothetical protein FAI41_04875 [Acetobacteraceae bacterium]
MIFSRYPGRYPLFFQAAPSRFRMTLEMTFVTLIAVLIGQSFHLPLVDIYPVVLIILWKDNRVLNIAIGGGLIVVCTLLVLLVFLTLSVSANNDSLKFITEVGFAFLFFFLTIGSKLGLLLGPVCGFAMTYALVEIGRIPIGEVSTEVLLYLLLAIYISCGGLILGGVILSPSPKKVLCKEIAWRLRVSADLLTGQHKEEGSWEESETLLNGGAMPLLKNVKLASFEKLWEPLLLNRLRQATLHAFSCLVLSRMAVSEMGWKCVENDSETQKLAKIMREMSEIFEKGNIALAPLVTLKKTAHPALLEISQQLASFSEINHLDFPKPPKSGFFAPGALQSAENYRFATKGAFTVGICICLYQALNWQGIHTCVITCFLVGLPTVGQMLTKQVARISGTLVGAVFIMLAMIFILPTFTNIAELLLLMGIGLGAAAWFKTGPEKFSYAGFQVAVVIALSALGKNGPSLDLTTPRDRIIGIFVGLILTYIIFTRLWPTSSATRLPALFQKCFSALERQYESKDRVMRLFWASAAQGAMSEAKDFLTSSRREVPPVRLAEHRLQAIENALNSSHKLMQTLLLPPTEARMQSAQKQKEVLKRLLDESGMLEMAGKAPRTKEFQNNPAPI